MYACIHKHTHTATSKVLVQSRCQMYASFVSLLRMQTLLTKASTAPFAQGQVSPLP